MRALIALCFALLVACIVRHPAPNVIGNVIVGDIDVAASVLEHHKRATRDGVFVDAALTHAAVAGLTLRFSAPVSGPTYAEPLYVAQSSGQDLLIVATEQNQVQALDASNGAVVWRVTLAAPVPLAKLPCGNINPLGTTGTPIIDAASRTIFVAAMSSDDGGVTKLHRIFALSLDDGSVRAGWPVDVGAVVTSGTLRFDPAVQNQRGALALMAGTLYVPYGGHYGDCGDYHGWVVAVPIANPTMLTAFATAAKGGGAWSPSGVASDGKSVFVSTGNTFGAQSWSGGEAILRLAPGAVFSGAASDYFAPADWQALDAGDVDVGGTGPVLFTLPDGSPRVLALGKNGKAYVLDKDNLGGEGGAHVELLASGDEIINAAVAYPSAGGGSRVAFKGAGKGCPAGQSGSLTALDVTATSLSVAWCADGGGMGSPSVSFSSGSADGVIWVFGAEGDLRLHALDAETGAALFASKAQGNVRRYTTPIVAKGRVFVAGDDALYAFGP